MEAEFHKSTLFEIPSGPNPGDVTARERAIIAEKYLLCNFLV